MTQKVPCKECGNFILPSTAEKNGGLCMPCRGNYRKNIEESQRRNEEDKRRRESPEWKYWLWLVDTVFNDPAGYEGLSRENQLYFAANIVQGEVFNGGFDQYFTNSSGAYFLESVEALQAIGALESRKLLVSAKQVIFGHSSIPKDKVKRFELIELLSGSVEHRHEKNMRLDDLDSAFYKDPDNLAECFDRYAKKHGLYSSFG